jgi:hypothetical protein
MPTLFTEINAIQSPISIGKDSSSRAMLSVNFLISLVGSPLRLEEKIASIISAAGLGILGTNMWYGSLIDIPQNNPGPLISILLTHNNNKISRPTIQIVVRASTYNAASDKINLIYALLDGRHNITV